MSPMMFKVVLGAGAVAALVLLWPSKPKTFPIARQPVSRTPSSKTVRRVAQNGDVSYTGTQWEMPVLVIYSDGSQQSDTEYVVSPQDQMPDRSQWIAYTASDYGIPQSSVTATG